MTTYRIKRFADPQQQESHTLRNTLIGVGTIGAGLLAGKSGYLGTGLQKSINKGWAATGNAIGSKGMVRSGVTGQAEAIAKEANPNTWADMSGRQRHAAINKEKRGILKDNQEYKNAWQHTTPSDYTPKKTMDQIKSEQAAVKNTPKPETPQPQVVPEPQKPIGASIMQQQPQEVVPQQGTFFG